jgi:hypothetical protein
VWPLKALEARRRTLVGRGMAWCVYSCVSQYFELRALVVAGRDVKFTEGLRRPWHGDLPPNAGQQLTVLLSGIT